MDNDSDNDNDHDQDNDNDHEGELNLAGFLFGNVDEHGRLENDFLDEEAKQHLSSLSRWVPIRGCFLIKVSMNMYFKILIPVILHRIRDRYKSHH